MSGYISLIYGTGYSMSHPFLAHNGPVLRLASSTLHTDSSGDHHSYLASLGGDEVLCLWLVKISSQKEVTLQSAFRISIAITMNAIAILGPRLCIATTDNQVIMYDIPPLVQGPSLSTASPESPVLLSHHPTHDHAQQIISLTASPLLKLFLTSSADGSLKTWDMQNQLVSDLQMGRSLGASCFTSAGDMLVGFKHQLFMVPASRCLPPSYSKLVTKRESYQESVPAFDSQLKFWYVHTHSGIGIV